MSIDINWDAVTSGPDGAALADRIRDFIHDKFQTVQLPRFIKSVTVHGFDFGSIPPRLELKDITDPLPDFYDAENDEDEDDEDDGEEEEAAREALHRWNAGTTGGSPGGRGSRSPEALRKRPGGLREEMLKRETDGGRSASPLHDMGSPFLGVSTPGILGGPGLNYFQGQFGTGTHTPLAAVAGAHMSNSWLGGGAGTPGGGYGYGGGSGSVDYDSYAHSPSHSRNPSQSSISVDNFAAAAELAAAMGADATAQGLREKSSVSTLAATSSRPPTRDAPHLGGSAIEDDDEDADGLTGGELGADGLPRRPRREPRVEDVQAVFRIRYAGDVKLNLTAEILLDYPMPSFVGIPLKLNITGLTFDGVGVAANIRKRLHFCFLSPEDAFTAVGPDEEDEADGQDDLGAHGHGEDHHSTPGKSRKPRFGGLLQEMQVESEIGGKDGGKQSLKNVGKVERFVLEQVRKIFEDEFVYPSFWTFLV